MITEQIIVIYIDSKDNFIKYSSQIKHTYKSFIQTVAIVFDMKLVYVPSSMKGKQAAKM